ncbi:MAG: hypothetical protein LBG67_03965 [Campylobacteraceae bacterium]|jgi:hypothetical protein|nr:hypothetical protein [Campylobacteraceae bacterium]
MYVKLSYFEDSYFCQIIKNSDKFLFVRVISDWHFDGYMIFVKKYIKSIKHTELLEFQQKVVEFYDKGQKKDVSWLNLNSYDVMFCSLRENYNEICIEGATENVNQFMIGKIASFDEKCLYINKLNTFGKITKIKYDIPIKEITAIFFGDEYSKLLFEYSKKTPIKRRID